MSAQVKAAPAPAAAPSRRGVVTPTSSSSASKRNALTSPSSVAAAAPSPAVAASPSPPPHAASSSFASTQPRSSFDESERKENTVTSPSAARGMKDKLVTLANRFDGMEDELQLSRSKRKADEDKRILILQTQLTNLQSSLALESKNRSMSVKALQNWLTDRIAQWTEQIEAPMSARLNALSEQITYLVGRIDGLERAQQQDRAVFPQLVDARCAELLKEISDLRAKFGENVAAREEKEKRLLLKVQSESNKAAVQFAQDKLMQDEKVRLLREAIDAEVAIRVKAHEMTRATITEEVESIRGDIAREKQERTVADEDLVQAINHYAAALQDGLKIVSTQ